MMEEGQKFNKLQFYVHIEYHFISHPKLVKVVVTMIKVSRAIYKDGPRLCRNKINHLTLDHILGLLDDIGDINIHLCFVFFLIPSLSLTAPIEFTFMTHHHHLCHVIHLI